jgi:hypothetical protein
MAFSSSLTKEKSSSPGVMQLESNPSSSGISSPLLFAFSIVSLFSFAVLNRLLLCWFILALGATPSMARKKVFWGLMTENKCWT